ncbi:MAG: hypothetical protein K6E91_00710 [Butyrivibrio sp.]|nr:hypothetical protein [Butyrivibrio sp.]
MTKAQEKKDIITKLNDADVNSVTGGVGLVYSDSDQVPEPDSPSDPGSDQREEMALAEKPIMLGVTNPMVYQPTPGPKDQ